MPEQCAGFTAIEPSEPTDAPIDTDLHFRFNRRVQQGRFKSAKVREPDSGRIVKRWSNNGLNDGDIIAEGREVILQSDGVYLKPNKRYEVEIERGFIWDITGLTGNKFKGTTKGCWTFSTAGQSEVAPTSLNKKVDNFEDSDKLTTSSDEYEDWTGGFDGLVTAIDGQAGDLATSTIAEAHRKETACDLGFVSIKFKPKTTDTHYFRLQDQANNAFCELRLDNSNNGQTVTYDGADTLSETSSDTWSVDTIYTLSIRVRYDGNGAGIERAQVSGSDVSFDTGPNYFSGTSVNEYGGMEVETAGDTYVDSASEQQGSYYPVYDGGLKQQLATYCTYPPSYPSVTANSIAEYEAEAGSITGLSVKPSEITVVLREMTDLSGYSSGQKVCSATVESSTGATGNVLFEVASDDANGNTQYNVYLNDTNQVATVTADRIGRQKCVFLISDQDITAIWNEKTDTTSFGSNTVAKYEVIDESGGSFVPWMVRMSDDVEGLAGIPCEAGGSLFGDSMYSYEFTGSPDGGGIDAQQAIRAGERVYGAGTAGNLRR
jgi:hypothetical protein